MTDTRDGVWWPNTAVVVNRHGSRITLWCEFWCLANSDGQTKAGNCEGARETRRDNELDGEAADQLGWPWRWRGRLKEEESTDQRLAEMSCLLIGRDQSQIRSGPTCKRLLQGVKAIGSTILGTKSNSSLTLARRSKWLVTTRWVGDKRSHRSTDKAMTRLSPKIAWRGRVWKELMCWMSNAKTMVKAVMSSGFGGRRLRAVNSAKWRGNHWRGSFTLKLEMVQKSWNSVKHLCLCTYVSLFMILMLQSAKQFNLYLVSLYSPVQRKFSQKN